MKNQKVSRAFPNAARPSIPTNLADEARAIASAVRRIGRGRGASPEAILVEKHDAADRLFALAARLETAR